MGLSHTPIVQRHESRMDEVRLVGPQAGELADQTLPMWEGQPSVRVPPAPRPPPSARLVARVAGLATGNGRLRIFGTIGWHRRLSRWWLPFSGTLLLRGLLPHADTELLILRTAWNCDSWYEWVQHVPLAARSGLGAAHIAGSAEGPRYPHWTVHQRLLVEAADQLHSTRVIDDRTWLRLTAQLSIEQREELCFLVGHYEMLAMTLNSFGVEPETSALRQLDPVATVLADRLAERLQRSRTTSARSTKECEPGY